MSDATSFHVRQVGKDNLIYKKIDDAMAKFDPKTAEELEKPIKKGTLCAALFSADGKWYRVRVLGTNGPGQFDVKFIDYGNTATVRGSTDLRILPAHLLAYEPQAFQSSFAYINTPRLERIQGKEAAKFVKGKGLYQNHDAIVVEQSGNVLKLILLDSSEQDWSESLNAYIISEGLASLTFTNQIGTKSNLNVPEEVEVWASFEEEAREA